MISRYTSPRIGAIWTDERKQEAWLAVQIAAKIDLSRADQATAPPAGEAQHVAAIAQVDQKLHTPACRLAFQNMLVKMSKTLESFDLKTRAQTRLEEPHPVRFESDPDLMA